MVDVFFDDLTVVNTTQSETDTVNSVICELLFKGL